ncbi:condensation domain-containing protein [Nocardia macrotermitis]|uniref:Trehalose-2-sulfate acyltransferase papA2 n=1 Tax=Nocardia macrotermitis TaxID=2585198 RepID=A0A7K0CUG1_9NOCA|nr:condensation domain-containing protein [Nocardia macrotermitis]MQY17120.1 Trehalose-2-sulfate acyltransferase papA2 [Nocardia macrotermitis]
MVNFGFFDDWHPQPGRVTSWGVPPTALALMYTAPEHPIPPTYQQREYLRTTHRTAAAGHRASRLCMISYDIPDRPNIAAMTRAVTAFVRRHESFASWFTVEPDDRVVRHVVDTQTLELVPTEYGEFTDSEAIRRHVQDTTPDALHWNCFSFGIIEHDNGFTVYAAVDHLHTDGVAQALTCVDLLMLYGAALSGTEPALAPVDGHLAYCARERDYNAALTAQSPQVATWLKLLQRNGGQLPTFPLYLGTATTTGYVRGAVRTMPLFTEDDAQRFEWACEAGGGRFLGGLFAALALTEVELTGNDWHFILSPANTRSTPGETGAVGYYTNLLPIAFDVPPDARFSALVAAAQTAADGAKALTDVSPHRVLELATPELGIRVQPGWAAMMLSYVDVRKIAGVEMFDRINGGLFANRAAASEVYLWINRFPDVTTLSLVYPDTEDADESIGRYVKTLTEITAAVADDGDYALRVDA